MSYTDDAERGQVGIGTLIIFISMVLVAAIAAGVLINTAGSLQTQAEATSEESRNLVSERIDVVSTVGIVDDSDNGTLGEIRIRVRGAVGSDQIDLSETTMQIIGPDGSENLVFTGTPQLNTTQSENGTALNSTNEIPENGFAVQNLQGDFVSVDNAIMSNRDNQYYTIILDPSNEPFGNFGEGESSSIDIISPSSATTRTEIQAPQLFQKDGEAVRL